MPAGTLLSTSSLDAGGILSPGVDLWIWQRRVHPPLSAYAETLAAGTPFSGRIRTAVDDRQSAVATLLDHIGAPSHPAREVLAQDIGSVVHLFAGLAGQTAAVVRLESDPAALCPLMHVDNVALRLVCTYSGPGTQWLARGDADRSQLGLRGRSIEAANAAIVRGPIRQLRPGHVAILKGGGPDGPPGAGVVHRSPPADAGRRLFLAVDIPDGAYG